MHNNRLSPLQIKLLEMMKWFHAFCEEHSIKYYVLGGTLLGAIRHEGFIPWDDDIDVGLPRKDYEKFQQLMNGSRGQYVLETPTSSNKDFCYTYSKIYDTHTTYVENKRIKVVRGVFLDVFPLDGLGENEIEARENYKRIERKYNLVLCLTGGIREGRKWYKNLAVRCLRLIPRFMLDEKHIIQQLDKDCAEHDFNDSKWGGNLMGAWRFKEVMPREIMGKPTLYKFEDMQVFGAEKADAYLTNIYGDWRKLPPKEKQVTHHDYLEIDLNKGYNEK